MASLKLHRGEPAHQGELRFHTGSLSFKLDGTRRHQTVWTISKIRRLYGLSLGGRWFCGFISFQDAYTIHEGSKRDG